MLKYLTELAVVKEIRQVMNTISSRFGKYKRLDINGINSGIADEKRSCWAIVSIDGFEIDAKIIHRGRGKFEILEDNYGGKYIGERVDASDVIRCKVEDDKPLKPKLMVRDCPRCDSVNTLENKHCFKCSYELTREQIKANEDLKLKVMEEKHKQDIEAIRQEMNLQFSQIMFIIQENYKLAHIANALRAKEINDCCTYQYR